MRKKRTKLVMIGLVAAIGLSGCGKKDAEETTAAPEVETEAVVETEPEAPTEAPKQDIKVALGASQETQAVKTDDFVPVKSDAGRWQKGKAGTWTFILNETNEVAKEAAVEMDGALYYFDADGNMANSGWAKESSGIIRYVKDNKYVTGWIDGKYYVDPEKGKLTGICEIEGVKYILDADGLAVDGWQEIDKKWHYAEKGKMVLGVKEIEDKVYGFDKDGVMCTGEVELSGKKYIFNDDGTAKTGLVDTEKGKVYCDEGEVQVGKVEVDGAILKFGEDGVIVTDSFVNGIYINADGTPDAKKRITNIGGFANKDGIDDVMNGLPVKFVNELFTQNGWKLIYDSKATGSLEEVSGTGAVSGSGKFLKFHNLDTVGHRLGHYVQIMTNKASGIAEARTEEFEKLGWDEFYNKNDTEYFSEACGRILVGNFDKEKAPKTYEYVAGILAERYEFKK